MPSVPPLPLPKQRDPRVAWAVRGALILLAAWLFGTCYARCGERPSFMALRSERDGASLSSARAVIVFLHGYGGSIGNSRWLKDELRKAGVGRGRGDRARGRPFLERLGRSWGDDAKQEATSIERVRALLQDALPEDGPPPSRVILAGFSQGAGIAADVAAVEPKVGVLASLSACRFRARDVLVQRKDLKSFIAHGSRDSLCSVGQSRALVEELRRADADVKYVEFEDNHVIAPQVVTALVELAQSLR